jgi:lipid-binding SYLF domain-containing protein
MNIASRVTSIAAVAVAVALHLPATGSASLTSDARTALRQLTAQNSAARKISQNALAVLVFPDVIKAGFIVGAQGGEGVLFRNGKASGRYRTTSASYGLQAGAQKYGYALFLMNRKAVDWVNSAHGWSLGTGPSVVVVDKGMARTISSETLHNGIYAFSFDQQGLMAGMGIQGSKITRVE